MTHKLFCNDETDTGIVIKYNCETGWISVAPKCHPTAEVKKIENKFCCAICDTEFNDKQVAEADQRYIMGWNVKEAGTSYISPLTNWTSAWTGIPPEDLNITVFDPEAIPLPY
jgi:hypothetical protein